MPISEETARSITAAWEQAASDVFTDRDARNRQGVRLFASLEMIPEPDAWAVVPHERRVPVVVTLTTPAVFVLEVAAGRDGDVQTGWWPLTTIDKITVKLRDKASRTGPGYEREWRFALPDASLTITGWKMFDGSRADAQEVLAETIAGAVGWSG
jgi:hypothetical protein